MEGINQEKLFELYKNQEFADEIVAEFIKQLPECSKRILSASENNDLKTLEFESHALLGASCYACADALSNILKEIESKIRHNNIKYLPTLLIAYKAECDNLLANHQAQPS